MKKTNHPILSNIHPSTTANKNNTQPNILFNYLFVARRGGVKIAGWTVDRKTRGLKDVFGRPGARVGVGLAR